MHRFIAGIVVAFLIGCGSADCLPEPADDATPPRIRVRIHYSESDTGSEAVRDVADPDSSVAIRARSSAPVRVHYMAADPEGLRQLMPGVTVSRSTAIGVDREVIQIRPETASCPVAHLNSSRMIPGTGEARTVILTAGAENWAGLRTAIDPITIRLE